MNPMSDEAEIRPSTRELRSRCRATGSSGPTDTRRSRSSGNARSNCVGSLKPGPTRIAEMIFTGTSRRRRSANASAWADEASTHWMSSTARRTYQIQLDVGSFRRRPNQRLDDPAGRPPTRFGAVPHRSLSVGVEAAGRAISSRTPPNRSLSVAKASFVSCSEAAAENAPSQAVTETKGFCPKRGLPNPGLDLDA